MSCWACTYHRWVVKGVKLNVVTADGIVGGGHWDGAVVRYGSGNGDAEEFDGGITPLKLESKLPRTAVTLEEITKSINIEFILIQTRDC